MSANIKSYPFPVLGNEDDLAGSFMPHMTYTLEPNKAIINCSFNLDNVTIENLISEGKAKFFIQAECSATFFRRTYSTSASETRIEIDSGDVRDRVTVSFYICAIEGITDYDPEGTHPDLAGETSDVEAGDVLAVGGIGWFMADKTFDPLKAPVSSFMKIKEGSPKSGPLTIEYDSDSILIVLSKDDFRNYKYARKYAVSSIHASLVFPALVDALHVMRAHKNEYSDSVWFGRIEQICLERKINIDEPIEAAQRLLGEPVMRALDELKKRISEDEDS